MNFIKEGSAFLFNSGFFKNGFGLDFTFQKVRKYVYLFRKRQFWNEYNESIVNYLPALTKQHDYSLNQYIYVYQSQPNVSFVDPELIKVGETGMQLDAYYFIKKKVFRRKIRN